MAVDLDHSFTTSKPIDESFAGDHRPRARRPVRRGRQRAREDGSDDSVKAEIMVKMGAMSMTFTGTVEVTEKDDAAHRAVLTVKSREAGGQGHANATVTFDARRRRRHDPHERPDHRQGGVDGRGRRRRRARRADQRLHGEALHSSDADGTRRDARGPRGRGARRRRDRRPGGRRPPGVQRQRARRLRVRRVRQRARRVDGRDADDVKVRVKCGRCKTINVAVTDEHDPSLRKR